MDGRGVPLSLVVTGANEHDVTQLDQVLQAIMVKRKTPNIRRSKHLCADAGYRGRRALEIIESHGYIPHVVGRRKEADAKRRNPAKPARRWVVEVCHSWFNRFRKLLVRYEKLERSFIALNHIAAAIIAFRKIKLTVNIFTDNFLGRSPAMHAKPTSGGVGQFAVAEAPPPHSTKFSSAPQAGA